VPDERMGEVVVAAVEPHAGAVVDEGALLAWIGERVAPYQRPRAVYVMALATGADLKVKRRLVAEILQRRG